MKTSKRILAAAAVVTLPVTLLITPGVAATPATTPAQQSTLEQRAAKKAKIPYGVSVWSMGKQGAWVTFKRFKPQASKKKFKHKNHMYVHWQPSAGHPTCWSGTYKNNKFKGTAKSFSAQGVSKYKDSFRIKRGKKTITLSGYTFKRTKTNSWSKKIFNDKYGCNYRR